MAQKKGKFQLKPLDFAVTALFLCAIFISFAKISHKSGTEQLLVITAPDAEYVYTLQEDAEYQIKGRAGISTICVSEGKAFFKDSACPNKTCVKSAPVSRTGEWSACLPNEVFLRIEDKNPQNQQQDDGKFDAFAF